jgi:predicted glycosyltransferase
MSAQVMFYVQHLMGIGHQRRMAAIARACADEELSVTYVSGGLPVGGLDVGPATFVQLPPCRSPDLGFAALVDAHAQPVDAAWLRARTDALLRAWRSAPHVALVVETYPFGRKLMRFELEPLVAAARADGARCFSSIRDIIEYRPKLKKYEAMAAAALADFDQVWVHADPVLMPLEVSFPPYARIAHLIAYTGYVREHSDALSVVLDDALLPAGEVIVSAGGGAYGGHIFDAALQAVSLVSPELRSWRLLVGQNVPQAEFLALAAHAQALQVDNPELSIVVERARPDFQALLRGARVSVSQGGYNTVMDVLSAAVPAVIVAYHDATEREQLIRARALAKRDVIELLPDSELTPTALAEAVSRASQRSPAALTLDTNGAKNSARLLAAAVRQRPAPGC